MDHDSQSIDAQLRLANLECLGAIDEVTRWLTRTRDLVSCGESYSREAFRQSLVEVQEGLLGAELDLAITLFEFERAMEEQAK